MIRLNDCVAIAGFTQERGFLGKRFILTHGNGVDVGRLVVAQHQVVHAPVLVVEEQRAIGRNFLRVQLMTERRVGVGGA